MYQFRNSLKSKSHTCTSKTWVTCFDEHWTANTIGCAKWKTCSITYTNAIATWSLSKHIEIQISKRSMRVLTEQLVAFIQSPQVPITRKFHDNYFLLSKDLIEKFTWTSNIWNITKNSINGWANTKRTAKLRCWIRTISNFIKTI